MAKKGYNGFDESYFLSKGFVKNKSGGFDPPPVKSEYIRAVKGELITKEPIVKTPDFTAKPVTEWYIKGSVPSKKNSRQNFVRNGKQISIPSKKHAEYVQATKMQYEVFGREFKRTVEILSLEYPLRIEFTFVRGTKHSFDYCNACQTCEDIMKGHWFDDDSADYIIPSFQPYQYDKENPGVHIKLLIK